MISTDIVRMLVACSVLAFAAATDLRWRRAPDACWWIMGAAGAALLAVDVRGTADFWAVYKPVLVTSALIVGLSLAGYFTGLIAGGADAKALAALAVLGPLPLDVGWSVPLTSPFPFVLTVLTNGLLLALLVPLVLLARNLIRGEVDGARTFLALRVAIDKVDTRVVWPLEHLDENGERVVALTPRGAAHGAFDADAFRARGIDRVWVTPKVPFLVPLWGGLVVAMLVGDPLAAALARVAG